MARHFDLATDRVLFAGLKDEDGITEQLIALDGQLSHAAINGFNAAHSQRLLRQSCCADTGKVTNRFGLGRLPATAFASPSATCPGMPLTD